MLGSSGRAYHCSKGLGTAGHGQGHNSASHGQGHVTASHGQCQRAETLQAPRPTYEVLRMCDAMDETGHKRGAQVHNKVCFLVHERGVQVHKKACFLGHERGVQVHNKVCFWGHERGAQVHNKVCFWGHERGAQVHNKVHFLGHERRAQVHNEVLFEAHSGAKVRFWGECTCRPAATTTPSRGSRGHLVVAADST